LGEREPGGFSEGEEPRQLRVLPFAFVGQEINPMKLYWMQRNPSFLFALLFAWAAALCSLLAISSSLAQAAEQVKINAPAPDFSLPDLSGKEISLSSLKGKVVLLSFWSIYCQPCRQEMPMIESLYQKYKNEGLEVVGVNIDRDPLLSVQNFVKENRVSFPILLDRDRKTMRTYRASFLPSTFLLDRGRIIVDKVIGIRDWSTPEYQGAIEKLLKKK
jgi:peroxiredoxin